MTIYRRRQEYRMMENPSGNITDDELREVLQQMRRELPSLGQTLVWGRLRSLGFKVTRARVRDAMRVTDPINTALRWREITPRRPYSVPGPNSLWHIGKLNNYTILIIIMKHLTISPASDVHVIILLLLYNA